MQKEEISEGLLPLCLIVSRRNSKLPPLKVQVEVDKCLISREVCTCASMSIMAETTYSRLWSERRLSTKTVRLCTYLKEPIPVVGCTNVKMS